MRTALLTVVTLLLAWGVWQVVGGEDLLPSTDPVEDGPLGGPDPSITASDERTYAPGTMPTSGTLVVRVLSKSGHVPEGARAGYVYGGRDRLRPVGERGQVTFTDTPLGSLEIVGLAPGFGRMAQRHYLNAGVPSEVLLVLTMKKGFKPPQDPPKDR